MATKADLERLRSSLLITIITTQAVTLSVILGAMRLWIA